MERLWTKSFIQMSFAMLFLFTGFYLLVPTLPLFIKEIGGNESQVGLMMGMFTIAAVVIRPIIGGMLDQYGRRSFIIFGLILFGLTMYSYNLASTIVLLAVLRVIHGVTWAVSTTAVGTAITDIIPDSRRGEGMGWYGMAMTIAMAIGPMIGLWVVQYYSFHGLFLLATLLSFMAVILSLITKMPFKPQKEKGKIQLFEKSVLSITVVVFFLSFAYGGITTFLPLFASSINVNPGTFFLVYAIALTIVRPISGKLLDKYGEVFIILPALCITILAIVVLTMANGLTGIIIAATLYGVGFGSAQPALQAAMLTIVDPSKRGVANASFFTAFDLGIGLGAILLGFVSQMFGYRILFTASSVSAVIALLVFGMFVRQKLSEKELSREG
ncbi:MFS transporter [Bacillus toyonensis]|uniref:MFS transporter n=1 Tax=Bacillus toyonensis TaxID=155322 RepID=UPI00028B6DA9|nr:MFS transporter [Bacillus toyonensis]AFU12977.1 Major facilitator superfamily MFS_1 [Bacillus thuringiensis MC28]OTX01195.1 MFS transporter [Bacillus thuringiensis serovar seoulensis]QPW48667.1 MFS transporter [Bacillus thuringiensis]MCA1042771.1 MFS transporter [Bacillus toyonensis]MDO8158660.1 MFS transporter [Bacillus toyonensis]